MKANLIPMIPILLSLLLAPTATRAAETDRHDRLRLFEFNFDCRYEKHWDHDEGCQAVAHVFAWVDPEDWMSTLQSTRDVQNRLAVRCDDHLVYADGAILDPHHERFVSISGLNGFPQVLVERHDHETVNGPVSSRYDSLLILGEKRLRGECEVRNRPVGDQRN